MRVLVCGGRNFEDRALLDRTLDEAHLADNFEVLIHGMARGADRLAHAWAERRGVKIQAFRPDWKKFGKAAGPFRNARMLKVGRPQMVIAFPGGRGTRDMVTQARAAGVPVIEIDKVFA